MRSIETNICFETQIIKGKEDILKRIEDVIQNASEKLDICISHHIVEDSSHKNHLLNSCKQAYERGVKIRYITKIKKENLLYVKQFLPVAKVRHLSNVVDVLVLNENEILCNIGAISSYFIFAPFLYSKTKEILKEQKHIFETLWMHARDINEERKEIEEKGDEFYFKRVKSLTQALEFFKTDDDVSEQLDIYLPRLEAKNLSKYTSVIIDGAFKNHGELNFRNIRYISSINKNNVRWAEKFLHSGIQIKHSNMLPPLNFILSDYMVSIFMDPFFTNNGSSQNIIITNEPNLLKQYKKVFEDLWTRGLDGSLRVNDVKSYMQRGKEEYEGEEYTQIIENTHKTQELLFKLINNATFEVLLILPSVNAFLREYNLKIWETLTKRSNVNIRNGINTKFYFRVLTPTNKIVDQRIKNILETNKNKKSHKQKLNIEFKKIESVTKIKTTCVIVDRKKLLAIETKDDSQKEVWRAIGSATYTNAKSTIFSYISIFDTIWRQKKLYENIRTTNEELSDTTIELKKALQEIITINKRLTEANEQLQVHDKMQKEFINIAAHELRTPTQSIVGYMELIKMRPKNFQKYLDPLDRNSERLYRLTEHILEIARIESDSLKLEKEEFDIYDLIKETINDFTNKSRNKNKNYFRLVYNDNNKDCNLDDDKGEERDQLSLYADKNRIQQVVSNLLSNAYKFTENGTITTEIKIRPEGQIIISIQDTGKGIDPTILPRLFKKFVTKSEKGTGLGLYISKNIVQAHGGKIWGENNGNGKGANFVFTLPFKNINQHIVN